MPYFAQQGDRLQPTKTFFDPFSLALTEAIAFIPSRAFVDGAAAGPRFILGDMRRDLHVAALRYETRRVEALVSSHRQPPLPKSAQRRPFWGGSFNSFARGL